MTAFIFYLCRMRKQCRERGKFFEDFIFYPVHKETEWRPFTGALFYPCLNQEDRTRKRFPSGKCILAVAANGHTMQGF